VPLGESDTRSKLIDPSIHACGWTEDMIRREETAGAIDIQGGRARRRGRGRIDYTLRIRLNASTQPVAVALIEAKAENLPPEYGLEQAKVYAACRRLNVQFAYSSNGHQFVEYDRFTGLTTAPRPMAEFPSPASLRERYEKGIGFSLASEAAKPLLVPYGGGEATRRYYQDAAIRAVLEKIARGERHALLSLATGSGKTFIAVNLLKKIADAGQLRRALFVCDRDELRSQGIGAFQNVFGADAADVYRKPDGTNNAKNARIHVATYQTLDVDSDDGTANFLIEHYPENYFSHIVIDECHRSAWGKWSQVLTRNPGAVQIGLTATPREIVQSEKSREALADARITADNLDYFGEPAYEYDMAQGIEDGYLAACEILRRDVVLDGFAEKSGVRRAQLAEKTLADAVTGEALAPEQARDFYSGADFESWLVMPERVAEMCRDLFAGLVASGGPEQKTIVFCARDAHADAVAATMNNLYADWCATNGRPRLDPYAFKCTAASGGGDFLPDFRGGARHHFVATTVDLLTTGIDVPRVRNVVFFKYVRSPIAFYQMVGRGTRIDIPTGKLMFRVYDYTDATRLFGEAFRSRLTPPRRHGFQDEQAEAPAPPSAPVIQVEGFDVQVTDAGRYILTEVDGRAMPVTVEEYAERLAEKLVAEAPTVDRFREIWIAPDRRRDLLTRLPDGGRSAYLLRALREMDDFDLYDMLAEMGYGLAPRTRVERAESFGYKQRRWLDVMPVRAAATVRALADQFAMGGTEGLENPAVFRTPAVARAGGLAALKSVGEPVDVLRETKERMFAA
jgi:type I restriction enzyme R subunit